MMSRVEFANGALGQQDTQIMLVCHKPAILPSDPIYLPIQVGSGPDIPGCVRDNTGDNIAEKNPSYCELTAQWWLWKNSGARVKGLMHYRRILSDGEDARAVPFESLAKRREKGVKRATIDRLLEAQDIVLPEPHDYVTETALGHYERNHVSGAAFDILRQYITERYPSYLEAYERSLSSRKSHLFNMLVAPADVFDSYSAWLFELLSVVEDNVDIRSYSPSEQRIFGYVSELLIDVWVDANHLRAAELPVLFLERQNLPKRYAIGALKKLGLIDPVAKER